MANNVYLQAIHVEEFCEFDEDGKRIPMTDWDGYSLTGDYGRCFDSFDDEVLNIEDHAAFFTYVFTKCYEDGPIEFRWQVKNSGLYINGTFYTPEQCAEWLAKIEAAEAEELDVD